MGRTPLRASEHVCLGKEGTQAFRCDPPGVSPPRAPSVLGTRAGNGAAETAREAGGRGQSALRPDIPPEQRHENFLQVKTHQVPLLVFIFGLNAPRSPIMHQAWNFPPVWHRP